MKKRILACGIALLLLFTMCGCRRNVAEAPLGVGTTTLMVYMIGSNAEAANGAASDALCELEQAGVDTSLVNVVVQAGGTKNWTREDVANRKNTTLRLTGDGFEVLETTDAVSMGDAQTLSTFLQTCYETYTAEHYALWIWAPGDGVVKGLGEDRLFDDPLTLSELDDALAASPFASEKLTFVGLDVNLAATLETACTLDAYAAYLLASQEVMASGGMDYSFLAELGKSDTPSLLKNAVAGYTKRYEAYAAAYDLTTGPIAMSCLDLSKTAATAEAVNALFTKAESDLPSAYPSLAAARLQTATLGEVYLDSSWGLTDLSDTARQLSNRYPSQATAVLEAVKAMVTARTDNTDVGGVSLYYPFDGDVDLDAWQSCQTEDLAAFTAYVKAFLKAKTDGAKTALPSAPTVTQTAHGTFCATLSDEQTTYTAATYTVFSVEDGEFTPLFSSAVKRDNDRTFTAHFDGNVLYGKTGFGVYFSPSYTFVKTIGETAYYHFKPIVTNWMVVKEDMPPDVRQIRENAAMVVKAEKTVGITAVTSLTAMEGVSRLHTITSKTRTQCIFPLSASYYPTVTDEGAVMPTSAWSLAQTAKSFTLAMGDGLTFEYAPLAAGRYAMVWEWTDVYGRTVCSQPLAFETDGTAPISAQRTPLAVTHTEGETVLFEDVDATVLLTEKEDGSMSFALRNASSEPVAVTIRLQREGEDDRVVMFSAPAGGESSCESRLVPLTAEDSGIVTLICTLQNAEDCTNLVYEQRITLTLE